MYKKILGVSLCLMLAFVAFNSASAALIGSLNLSSGTVNQSGTLTVSGSCGTAGANGSVTFQLGGNAIGSTTTTNATGNFSSSLVIPSTFNPGNTGLVAICPNGDTLSVPVTVNVPIGTTLNLNGVPVLGQSGNIAGVCGTSTTGSTVNLALLRNGVTTNLGSTTTSNANGNFTGNFAIPSNFGGGPVTIVATCPGGTISFNTALFDPTANVAVSTTTPRIGSTFTVNGVCGTTAGGNVGFLLSTPTMQQVIGSTTTGANGTFSTALTVPTSFGSGAATLVGFCPSGTVMTATVVLDPASTGGTVTLPGTTTGGSTGGTTSGGVTATPRGGVAAGKSSNPALMVSLLLIALGATGYVFSRKSVQQLN